MKRRVKPRLGMEYALTIVLIHGLFFSFECEGSQFGVQIEGGFQFTQLQSSGLPLLETKLFRAEIAGCNWRIRTADTLAELTNTVGKYCSYAFDGEAMYRLTSLDSSAATSELGTNKPVLKNGVITLGDFIPFDHSRSTFVWLALASHCYLERNQLARSKPAWAGPLEMFTDNSFYLPVKVVMLEPGSSFAKNILFFSEGQTLVGGGQKVGFRPPYDKGFKKAEYSVLETTVFEGKAFPKIFEFTVYNTRESAASSNDLDEAWIVRGHISQIRQLAVATSLLPETSGKMKLVDARVSSKGQTAFGIITDGWAQNDPGFKAQTLYLRSLEKENRKTGERVRMGVRLFLCLSVAGALAIALRSFSRINKRA